MLTTHRLAPRSATADSVVLFLHGLGDRGDGGLLDICRLWQRTLPNTAFLCPDAPDAFDSAPPDFGGRQWFPLHDFTQRELDDGVRAAAPALNTFIDAVLDEYKIAPAKLAIAGFSQGAMMAMHVAPRRDETIACVAAYSGLLTNAAHLSAEKKSAPPVLIAHGVNDDVVPFACMAQAAQILEQAHIPVQTLACPRLGHGIDDAGIETGLAFLSRHLV